MRDIVYNFLKHRFDPTTLDIVFDDFYSANKLWIEHEFLPTSLYYRHILVAKYYRFVKDFVPF